MNTRTNPVALVTGGTGGIGRAVCLRLAQDGHDVALCYASDSASARTLEKEIAALGRKVYARRTDVSDPAAVNTLVAGVQDALGPVTALVTSAGVLRDTPVVLMESDQWQEVLRVHLDGVYHVCRAVVDEMTRQRRGSVVNLSSVAGLLGNAGQANYAAAKAGVIGFTKSLAQEAGRYGVRANVVAPGYIATDPVRRLPAEALDGAVERVALRRLGEPEEVADLVSFLVSDRAAYITGSVLRIDGGFH